MNSGLPPTAALDDPEKTQSPACLPAPAECVRDLIQAADLLIQKGIDLLYSFPQRDQLHAIRARISSELTSTCVLVESGFAVERLVDSCQSDYLVRLRGFVADVRSGDRGRVLAQMDLARQLLKESGLLHHQLLCAHTRLLFCNFDVLLSGAVDGSEHLWTESAMG